jgi:hypothetical protein
MLLLFGCAPDTETVAAPAAQPLTAPAPDPAAPPPVAPPAPVDPAVFTWTPLAAGADLGVRADVHVARLDPAHVSLQVVQASPHTAAQLGEALGAVAVINTSMFLGDGRTSLGYLRDGDTVNNDKRAAQQSLVVASPRRPGLPGARLVDLGCEDWDAALRDWDVVVQSIRMLDCHGRNTWSEQPKRWSAAVIGMDHAGRILFIHSRQPRSMHALTEELRGPLDLAALQYAEGGPEAQLWVGGSAPQAWVGSYETGFNENDLNRVAWPVPNLLVAIAR